MYSDSDERWYRLAIGALILSAWIALWLWGASPYAGLLGHQTSGVSIVIPAQHIDITGQAHHRLPAWSGPLRLGTFILGWILMTMAMMLPSSLPLVHLFRRAVAVRPDRNRLMLLLGLGYLGIWAVAGIAAYLSDGAFHRIVASVSWLRANGWMIAPATFLLAGVYQFTPLKYRCLEECRSPYAFLVEHWRGDRASLNALRLGVRHGVFCVGCCWTLMLLMLAVGTAHLGWMLLLGGVMAAERATHWGRQITRPVGALLIVWAALQFASLTGVS